jgi:hypothetical protein
MMYMVWVAHKNRKLDFAFRVQRQIHQTYGLVSDAGE